MSPSRASSELPTHFTVDKANRTLPLVRAIVSDIATQQGVVNELSQRFRQLKAGSKPAGRQTDVEYTDEIKQFRHELELEKAKLDGYRHELARLGVKPREPVGHCDFPTTIDGHPAELCWMLGEPEVLYWHETDDILHARKPLVAEAGAGSDDTGPGRQWSGESD